MKNQIAHLLLLLVLGATPAAAGAPEFSDEDPHVMSHKRLEEYHDAMVSRPPRVLDHPIHPSDPLFFPAGWTGGLSDPSASRNESLQQTSTALSNRTYGRYQWDREEEEDDREDAAGEATEAGDARERDAGKRPATVLQAEPGRTYGREDSVTGIAVRKQHWRNQPGNY